MQRMKMIELYDTMGECLRNLNRKDISSEDFERAVTTAKTTANLAKRMITDANSMMQAKRSVGSLSKEAVDNLVGDI